MATNTPICVKTDCSNEAAFNKYFPDSDGGQYWTMCDACYNEEHGDEEEEVCGKWTEDKDELTDQDTGESCWRCENCGAYPDWGVDCE